MDECGSLKNSQEEGMQWAKGEVMSQGHQVERSYTMTGVLGGKWCHGEDAVAVRVEAQESDSNIYQLLPCSHSLISC